MVCVRSFVLLCQHFYTPSWPLPIRRTGISRKGLVSPGIWHYKNCVSIFFTRLLLRPSSPRIPKEKVVHHHVVMLSITHLVTFVVLSVYYSLFFPLILSQQEKISRSFMYASGLPLCVSSRVAVVPLGGGITVCAILTTSYRPVQMSRTTNTRTFMASCTRRLHLPS